MARCNTCDAESSGLGAIPYRASRKFHHDPRYPHLDICSDCIDSLYVQPVHEYEEGEIETIQD